MTKHSSDSHDVPSPRCPPQSEASVRERLLAREIEGAVERSVEFESAARHLGERLRLSVQLVLAGPKS